MIKVTDSPHYHGGVKLKTRKSFLTLFLVFLWISPTVKAANGVKVVNVGSPAPPFTLKDVLQAPPGIHGTWEELKGKAVVIEFWATWCGGCVLSSSAERQIVYTSPDGRLTVTVIPAGKKKGFEDVESRIEVLHKGSLLLGKDFSSEDGEHGAGIVRGHWTSDSMFFVFLTEFSGGHTPLLHPIYFYCRRENTINMLNPFLDDVLTQDFSLKGRNTVAIAAQDMRGQARTISVKLGTVPCGSIATCYRLGSPHRTVPAREYIFQEDFNPDSLERRVYVRRPGEQERRLIFTHFRGVSECVGPSGHLALINSFLATKAVEVYAADLSSGRSWRIDAQAVELYKDRAHPNPALIIVPNGEDMSPGDGEALLRMDLIYASVPTPEQAEQVGKTFQQWWYVVDSRDGKVLREYRTPAPMKWWVHAK